MQERLLIIDDDKDMCRELADILADEGYKVSTAFDGVEASELIRDNAYELVLLDLKMPKKGGIEVLDEIKKNHPNIKVIVISGSLSVVKLMQEGRMDKKDPQIKIVQLADGILNKPFRVEEIITTIKNLLS